METLDINPKKESLLATNREGVSTGNGVKDKAYDMATGTEKSFSDDSQQNIDHTDFEEVELNFSKDCYRIKLVSLRTQSDSDLDTDIHSQQVHGVNYMIKQSKTNDPEKCGEAKGNGKYHSNESEDVVQDRVDSPRVDAAVLGKFTDMKSMLKQVLASEHPEAQPNSEANSLVTNRTRETDSNILGTEENITEHKIDIVFVTDDTPCMTDTISSASESDITKIDKKMKKTAKPDRDKEKKETQQSGSDDENKEVGQPGSEQVKEMTQPDNSEDRHEATQSESDELQKEPPWMGDDEENKEAAEPDCDELQNEAAQSDSDEEKMEAEEPDNAEEKREAPYIDSDEEQKETTQSNSDPDDDDDDIEALMEMFDSDLILHLHNSLDLNLFEEDEGFTDDDEELAQAQLRQNYGECQVCFEVSRIDLRSCCQFKICRECFSIYLDMKISEGLVVQIQCPNFDCQRQLSEYEVSSHLSHKMKLKYLKFLTDARQDPTEKTCPRCGCEQHMDEKILKKKETVKKGLPVTCQACSLYWCFTCQAPWHEGVTCKEYKKGDREFRKWTQEHDERQANAQKCPRCKVYIQRSSGCPHMTCPRCSTDFCYDCGGRFYPTPMHRRARNSRAFRMLLGTHDSRLGVLGCSHNFLPQSNTARRVVRGSVLGAKLVGGVCALAVGVGVATVVVVVAPVVWGTAKIRKKVRERRRNRARHH